MSFLCAWQLFDEIAPATSSLDFFSVEKYPLEEQELTDALALWPALHHYANELITRWRRRVPGWNRWTFGDGRIRLTLVIGDVAEALPEICGGIDAWFLDGFSPALNPEMWTQQVLEHIAKAPGPGATFATYTSAGWVRRGLEQAGFQVSKSPGFGRKREMLQGRLPGSHARKRLCGIAGKSHCHRRRHSRLRRCFGAGDARGLRLRSLRVRQRWQARRRAIRLAYCMRV